MGLQGGEVSGSNGSDYILCAMSFVAEGAK